MTQDDRRSATATRSEDTGTPRVAVLALPGAGLTEDFIARLDTAARTAVLGVVLDRPAIVLTDEQARAAALAAARMRAYGLPTVLVTPADVDDAATLDAAGFAAGTAPSLAAALARASRGAAEADVPRERSVAAEPAGGPDPLADTSLALLAQFGLRFRTGALLAARAARLTVPEFLIVGELAVHECVPARELGRLLALPTDELATALVHLRDLGLVTDRDEATALALTALGREVLFAPAAELAEDLRAVCADLEPEVRDAVHAVLGTWSTAQERHNERLRERLANGHRTAGS